MTPVKVTDVYGDSVTVDLGEWEKHGLPARPEVYLTVAGSFVAEDTDEASLALTPHDARALAEALLEGADAVDARS